MTGFLNLTIDRAPTRPRDNAKLLDITEVTEYVMIGNKNIDNVWAKVLIQIWLLIIKHCLIIVEKITIRIMGINIVEPCIKMV